MKINPIDRLVMFFAPGAGRRRLADRYHAERLMNYDAASKGRRTYGWKGPATDADAAAYGVRGHLRNLSRDMVRNRAYAARARDVVVVNVVGTGIPFSVEHTVQGKREAIEAVLKAHLLSPDIDARGEYDLMEMQSVVMKAVFTDGEVLARRRLRPGIYGRGLALGFQIELLEADYLDETKTSNGANQVLEGVEYGPTGAIEAYWLYDEHPGSASLSKTVQSRRVAWQDVLHIRRFDRPGQLRGVPWLAPVMLTMGELSDYQEAQILKQKISALLAGVVAYDPTNAPTGGSGKIKGLEDLEPGALVQMPDGATVTFTTPPRVDDYKVFMAEGLGAVAMGIGITRESLTGDLSGVNFSSGRMGRMEMDRNVEVWQANLMIRQFCGGVARWVRDAWRMQTVLPGEAIKMEWTAPRRALIDPKDEIAAMLSEVEGGLNSRQAAQRRLGYDPDRVRRERVEDADEDKAAKLAAPGAVPGAAADAPAGDTQTQETDDANRN